MKSILYTLIVICFFTGCNSKKSSIPVVAFIDAFQDNTIAQAKQGFFDALQQDGFDEKKAL